MIIILNIVFYFSGADGDMVETEWLFEQQRGKIKCMVAVNSTRKT